MFDNNIDRYTSDGLIHDNERLKELQSLPLSQKIGITIARITEFVQHFGEDGVYVSVSGGKDSAVLWDITHKLFPNAVGVFSDTGLEYPEVREYAMNIAIDVVKPKMSFAEVIKTYGYPVASKEISSAIYYARRNKLPKAERERERERESNRISKESVWKRMELMGQRPPVTRKEWYSQQEAMGKTQVIDTYTPPMYGKTTGRKRSELLGTRDDSCTAKQLSEKDVYG